MTLRKPMSKKLRFEVFKRDGFACQYCGATAPSVKLHVDHVIPVSRGGTNAIENLTTACEGCNAGKGAGFLDPLHEELCSLRRDYASVVEELLAWKVHEYDRLLYTEERVSEGIWRALGIEVGGELLTRCVRTAHTLGIDQFDSELSRAVGWLGSNADPSTVIEDALASIEPEFYARAEEYPEVIGGLLK